ncbi:hypothetical protein Taro_002721 [Colocasia esculenta]|uniref:Uncharacterized protein n=1 Tax=Colocasia esculenta TaxID=4460 RepID=A0A843TPN3_COLES|nr:hypothetical protein [Colocasia esculenta]
MRGISSGRAIQVELLPVFAVFPFFWASSRSERELQQKPDQDIDVKVLDFFCYCLVDSSYSQISVYLFDPSTSAGERAYDNGVVIILEPKTGQSFTVNGHRLSGERCGSYWKELDGGALVRTGIRLELGRLNRRPAPMCAELAEEGAKAASGSGSATD